MLSRRNFIFGVLCLILSACTRHRYERPAGRLELGKVRELLYNLVHIRQKATMVFRDAEGWRALSTRCTYNGCDLTYQFTTKTFLCPCCKSEFDINGIPFSGGAATVPLPYMEMQYVDGRLYADPGRITNSKYRFTTPEIEAVIKEARIPIKQLTVAEGAKVPEILKGKGDGEEGEMFVNEDPLMLDKIDKIK